MDKLSQFYSTHSNTCVNLNLSKDLCCVCGSDIILFRMNMTGN